MALIRRGKYWYGDDRADIRSELLRYSGLAGYPASHFADARCSCGHHHVRLLLDEGEGVAVRACDSCGVEHPIGDGADYLAEAELESAECPCGGDLFEVAVGVALYEESEDVRWVYVGCRCPACSLTACYGDWKNEFEGYREYLARV